MKSYRITLTPLEPYFFGGERGFNFGSEKGYLKQRYFISSLDTPSQTTLLGALRYAVLAANGALIKDFTRGSDDRKRADELVGSESFDFSRNYSFGAIGRISPLFILDNEDYLVPMPMNHKNGESHYSPMEITQCPSGITLSKGNVYSPDYKAKDGCGEGWLKLSDKSVVPYSFNSTTDLGMFQSLVRVGINSQRSEAIEERNDEDGFFKKEFKMLRRGAFAFFANLDPEKIGSLKQGVTVFLGQNKSAFILKAVEQENDLEKKIADALSKYAEEGFWYAPADCYFEETFHDFAISKSRLFRHLRTGADNRFYYRINKTRKLFRLMQAGAVFYGNRPTLPSVENANTIGMNVVFEIKGGNKNGG